MYLVSENFYSNIHGTVKELNRLGIQRFVLHFSEPIVVSSVMITVVVFSADNYDNYKYLCEKLRTVPVTLREFVGNVL